MNRFLFGCVIAVLMVAGCSKKSRYRQMVDRELKKGIQNDSLFLGYHFGMSRQQFYDHSWKLNSQKKITQGSKNKSVRYDNIKWLDHSGHMNFYPEFYKGKIYKMKTVYSYNGWAPWNRNLWSDSLQVVIRNHFQSKYGESFIEMKHPELKRPSYILVDANKRIAISSISSSEVAVIYVDLRVLNKLKVQEE